MNAISRRQVLAVLTSVFAAALGWLLFGSLAFLIAIPLTTALLAAFGDYSLTLRRLLWATTALAIMLGGSAWFLIGGYCQLGIPGDCT